MMKITGWPIPTIGDDDDEDRGLCTLLLEMMIMIAMVMHGSI